MLEIIKNYEKEIKKLKEIQNDFILLNSITDYNELLKNLVRIILSILKAKKGVLIVKDNNSLDFKINYYLGMAIEKNTLNINNESKILKELKIKKQIKFLEKNLISEILQHDMIIKNELFIPLCIDNYLFGIIIILDIENIQLLNDSTEILEIIVEQSMQHLDKINLRINMERKMKLKNVLIDITNYIEKVFILKDVFDVIMKKLADKFGIIRGMLVLFDKDDISKLSVFSAYNLTEEEIARGIYRVGEGVVGKVVESGKSISISDINKDPIFLNRMKIKRDKNKPISFIAVPIKIAGVVFGVLAIEKYFECNEILKDEEDMLFLISGIIANKVKVYQKMNEEKSVLLRENLNLKKELYKNYGINNIIGKNKKMLDLFELIQMVADSSSSIMILGDSGTGKELVAKALHFNSSRKFQPFISINCAAIPENLLESELFGYKKGAFTGASIDKKGKFLLADGGTLFLDEIGDMPLYLQAKLLRAIQEKVIEPIGSELNIEVNIRIISATNKDPKELIKIGKLREDLYYRLNVVEIKLPQLKERKDDIPLLVQFFLEKYSKLNNRKTNHISPDALIQLQAYHWPGNVRELENVIERAILLSKSNTIEIIDLPSFIVEAKDFISEELHIRKWIDNFITNSNLEGKVYNEFMNIIEKELLIKSLLFNNRNKIKTSGFLGINRNTLRSKVKKYKINMM